MSAPAARDTKCAACNMAFNGEAGLTLHLASSTVCPKSTKFDAEAAKEKDTKCEHCQLPCRGEKGLEAHLRRSRTCPGGRIAIAIKEGTPIEKKVRKAAPKKDEKKDEKKDASKKKEKKEGDNVKADTPCPDCGRLFVGETGLASHKSRSNCGKTGVDKKEKKEKTTTDAKKRTRAPKKERVPIAEADLVACDGCDGKFTANSLATHLASSATCPKSAKYSKEAHEKKDKDIAARKEAFAARKAAQAALRDTECKECKTLHKGEKGLATHLAKSTTCPASAQYVKSE